MSRIQLGYVEQTKATLIGADVTAIKQKQELGHAIVQIYDCTILNID